MVEKILITGITGFVGSHLADYAIEKNCEIYGLKRWNLSRLRNVRHIMDKINWIDCDITDPVSTKKALESCNPDKIFHLAAESFVSPSWNHPSHYMDVNYKGTVNLFEAIKDLKFDPKILIPGSGEYIIQPISIDDVCKIIHFASESKLVCKKIIDLVGPQKLTFKQFLKNSISNSNVNIEKVPVSKAYHYALSDQKFAYGIEDLNILLGNFQGDYERLKKLSGIKFTKIKSI